MPLLALSTGVGLMVLPPTAAFADSTITSSGPLTTIFTSTDLNCQVQGSGDGGGEFFNGGYASPACGTFIATGSQLYGPASVSAGPVSTPYQPVSQTGPTGTGTSGDPFVVVTVVDLPSTSIEVTQTDTYVMGDNFYTTGVQLTNTDSESSAIGTIYRAGDCYLGGNDTGYGRYDSGSGAIACTAGTGLDARLLQWTPTTAGSHYTENYYSTVWDQVSPVGNNFDDSCACASFMDNGSGLSWSFDIPADGSDTFSQTLTVTSSCTASAPGAPVNVHAFPGNASAAVSWDAPDGDGGAPIESYTVNIYDESGGGGGFAPIHADSVQTPDTSVQITGLNNGDTYHFTVQATNCAGTSNESDPSESVTPTADSSAQPIDDNNLTQKTGDTATPTASDTTIGVQTFPPGTTGIGTLEELDPNGGGLAAHGAAPLSQFCSGGTPCIGNILEARLHNGSLGTPAGGGLPFYTIKLYLDKTLVKHLGTNVRVWYDGNLADDGDTSDPTPPSLLVACSRPFTGGACYLKISRVRTYDLKIVVKTQDIDPRLSTSK
ncbi:MAG: fibronectin type III domain-containing protein [Actinomycetota bacterium]